MNQSGGYIFTVNMNSMQFILPISMLSFLFSQSPGFDGLLDFLQIYGFDSTCTVSIRAKRAYAFLLFNGLLALLINNSGASKSSLKTAIETTVLEVIEENDNDPEQVLSGDREEYEENDDDDYIVVDRVPEQVSTRDHEECEEIKEYDECDDTDDVLTDDDDEEDEYDRSRCDDLILADESDEEETEDLEVVVWGISVEELNSKCDDFIKNMRHLL